MCVCVCVCVCVQQLPRLFVSVCYQDPTSDPALRAILGLALMLNMIKKTKKTIGFPIT